MADSNITEKYEFLTQLHTAYDTTEQRMPLRSVPRIYISYDYEAMTPWQAQWLKAAISLKQTDTIYIPQWHNASNIVSVAYAGSTSISLSKQDMYKFRNCFAVMLFNENEINGGGEVYKLDKILTNNTISLKKGLSEDKYNNRDVVIPLMNCYIQPTDNVSYEFSSGITTTINYEIMPEQGGPSFPEIYGEDNYEITNTTEYWEIDPSYLGKEIFKYPPTWENTIGDKIEKNAELLDNDTGRVFYDLKSESMASIKTISYMAITRSDINNFIKFFYRVKGKQFSFYIPTWLSDIESAFDLKANDSVIYTKLNMLYKFYAKNNKRKTIMLFLSDFTTRIVKISAYSYEVIDGVTYGKLFITGTIGENINKSDIEMISYLTKVRLDDDAITIKYETVTCASIDLTFREVDQ